MGSEAEEMEFLKQEEERLRKVIEEARRMVCDTTLEAETRDIPALQPIHFTARVFSVDDAEVEVRRTGLNLLKLFSFCKPKVCFCDSSHKNHSSSSFGSIHATESWPRKIWRRLRKNNRRPVHRNRDSHRQE